ncbi:MAG: hypothetical protein AMXMBFR13_31570 [Phycisphaerae bacterium]
MSRSKRKSGNYDLGPSSSAAPVSQLGVGELLAMIDLGYDRKAWHGPNLRGALRRVDLETASFRPGPKRRNIWEIVVHSAYWKYAVRRRLLNEPRGEFPLEGSNWFERPVEPTREAWGSDLRLLEEMHRTLRTVVAALPADQLHVVPDGCKVSNFVLIAGVASHDVYHAGQIQLLKRLAGDS